MEGKPSLTIEGNPFTNEEHIQGNPLLYNTSFII